MSGIVKFMLVLILLYVFVGSKCIANWALKSVQKEIYSIFSEVNQTTEVLVSGKNMIFLYQDCYGVLTKFLFYIVLSISGVLQLFFSCYWMKETDIAISVLVLTVAIAVIEAKTNYIQKKRIEQDIKNSWNEIIDKVKDKEEWIAKKEARRICKGIARNKQQE